MYLNIIQLAESFGVEESVVQDWIRKEGLPYVPDRGRLLFDRAQIVAWAAERGLAARAGFLAPARSPGGVGRGLDTLLRAGGVWRDVSPTDVLKLLEGIVTGLPGATSEVRGLLARRVHAPGGMTWAPLKEGLALPHLRAHVTLGRDAGLLALLFLTGGLPLEESPADGVPINRLLFFIAPSPRAHLEMLAQLSSALTRGDLRRLVKEAAPDEMLFAALASAPRGRPNPEQPEAQQ